MSAARADPEDGRGREGERFSRTGLALGFLAMVPLLAFYELSLRGGGPRSTAELLVLALPERLGWNAAPFRWAALGLFAALAAGVAARRPTGVLPPLVAIGLEGLLGGLALGPLLVGLMLLLPDAVPLPALGGMPDAVPDAGRALFVMGAAAWEEILFRLGLYGALYLVGRRVGLFLLASERAAGIAGEVAGLVGSSLAFAALHLERFTGWLGPGGEPFELSVFTWRLIAGILLGLLLRWRGPGVVAWSHALFNLALLLGAGPEVFVGPT